MIYWIDQAPIIAARGENICVYSLSGRPRLKMSRAVALASARALMIAVADLEDRPAPAIASFPAGPA